MRMLPLVLFVVSTKQFVMRTALPVMCHTYYWGSKIDLVKVVIFKLRKLSSSSEPTPLDTMIYYGNCHGGYGYGGLGCGYHGCGGYRHGCCCWFCCGRYWPYRVHWKIPEPLNPPYLSSCETDSAAGLVHLILSQQNSKNLSLVSHERTTNVILLWFHYTRL